MAIIVAKPAFRRKVEAPIGRLLRLTQSMVSARLPVQVLLPFLVGTFLVMRWVNRADPLAPPNLKEVEKVAPLSKALA